ncbi:MAG TPA: type II toxin-antitoxin system VapC family toxin [Thermoleophilia bacterium]|nr:type II toxin-antitoxin system VapC family toxin [Thermoleophilia bacterium]
MIVLDTHAWVWWIADPVRLSRKAKDAADRSMADGAIYVSSISCWELALLARKGRLELTMTPEDWIARSEALGLLRFVPVDNHIAARSVALPAPLHDDPADRIIVATALSLGATLVTKDRRLRRYRHVKSLW